MEMLLIRLIIDDCLKAKEVLLLCYLIEQLGNLQKKYCLVIIILIITLLVEYYLCDIAHLNEPVHRLSHAGGRIFQRRDACCIIILNTKNGVFPFTDDLEGLLWFWKQCHRLFFFLFFLSFIYV